MAVHLAKAGFPAHGPLNGFINEKTKRKNASCKTSQESARSRPKKACRNLVQNDDYPPTAGPQVRTAEGAEAAAESRAHIQQGKAGKPGLRGVGTVRLLAIEAGGLPHRAGHGRRGQVKDLRQISTKADTRQQAASNGEAGHGRLYAQETTGTGHG